MRKILKVVGVAACIAAGTACLFTLIAGRVPKATHRLNPATGRIEEIPPGQAA